MSRLKTLRDQNARRRYSPYHCREPNRRCGPAIMHYLSGCGLCPHASNNLPKLYDQISEVVDE